MENFDDKYFAKQVEKKKKKGEGEFFEAQKKVCSQAVQLAFHLASPTSSEFCDRLISYSFYAMCYTLGRECAPSGEEG